MPATTNDMSLSRRVGVTPVALAGRPVRLGSVHTVGMPSRVIGNLTAEVTSLVDRRHEVAEVKKLLSAGRLVTLTGAAGIGKTRLAKEAGAGFNRAFRDGVWLVELANTSQHAVVVHSFRHALRLSDEPGDPVVQLCDYLQDKQLLIIADNCEHVIEACGTLLSQILARAPEVRVIATSRQVLGIEGEHMLPVPPLPIIESVGARRGLSADGDAVHLFAERATAAVPAFQVTEENRRTVVRICRHLDGIPLALELAAVRLRAFDLDEIAAHVDDRMHLLGRGYSVPAHHRTLEGAIRWSYDLCTPLEQRLWHHLSVFADGFSLDAANEICVDVATDDKFLRGLLGLIDKSIVSRAGNTQGTPTRYEMLHVLRQFGQQRLDETDDAHAARVRHLRYFAALADRGRLDYCSPREADWLAQLEHERSNLRTALEFSLASPELAPDGLAMATQLRPFWMHSGSLHEGLHWIVQALDNPAGAPLERARAAWAGGHLALLLSEHAGADEMMRQLRSVAEREDHQELVAFVAFGAALKSFAERDLSSCVDLAESASRQLRRLGDHGSAAEALSLASMVAFLSAHPRSRELADALLSQARETGSVLHGGLAHLLVGINQWRDGDDASAAAHIRTAIEAVARLERPPLMAICLEGLAWVWNSQGDATRAVRLMGAAGPVWQSSGWRLVQDMATQVSDEIKRNAREQLGEDLFQRELSRGAALTLPEVIPFALDKPPVTTPRTAARPAETNLTPREIEVAKLVAQGMTNREIANGLVISTRTVEAHVDHILTKLGVHSRATIASWVTQTLKASPDENADGSGPAAQQHNGQ
jgi:predicted ATPase/DNA-binding CsgD family transcriptional regulator